MPHPSAPPPEQAHYVPSNQQNNDSAQQNNNTQENYAGDDAPNSLISLLENATLPHPSALSNIIAEAQNPPPISTESDDSAVALAAELAHQQQVNWQKYQYALARTALRNQDAPTAFMLEALPTKPAPLKMPRRLKPPQTIAEITQEMSKLYADLHYKRLDVAEYTRRIYGLHCLTRALQLQADLPAIPPAISKA